MNKIHIRLLGSRTGRYIQLLLPAVLLSFYASGQPQVNKDRTVTFRVFAPGADSVKLEGDLIMELTNKYDFSADNSTHLTMGPDGTWSVTLGPLPDGPYLYNISIDGRAGPDPANFRIFIGQKYRKSIVLVNTPAKSGIWETQNVEHGTVHRHTFYSEVSKSMSELFVYTPPGYEESNMAYPVLYLLHGRGEKADSWLQAGFVDNICDNLIASGKAEKSIIVMPFGWVIPGDAPQAEIINMLMPNLEKEMFTHIIPLIERSYRVITEPDGNAIAGFSLGGAQTAYIGFRHPEKFSSVAVLSAGLPDFEKEFKNITDNPVLTNGNYKFLLLCSGSRDNIGPGGSSIDGQKRLNSLLEQKGIRHLFYEMPDGGHTWKAWRYYFGEKLLPNLFKDNLP